MSARSRRDSRIAFWEIAARFFALALAGAILLPAATFGLCAPCCDATPRRAADFAAPSCCDCRADLRPADVVPAAVPVVSTFAAAAAPVVVGLMPVPASVVVAPAALRARSGPAAPAPRRL